jgi:hypothetical protein
MTRNTFVTGPARGGGRRHLRQVPHGVSVSAALETPLGRALGNSTTRRGTPQEITAELAAGRRPESGSSEL